MTQSAFSKPQGLGSRLGPSLRAAREGRLAASRCRPWAAQEPAHRAGMGSPVAAAALARPSLSPVPILSEAHPSQCYLKREPCSAPQEAGVQAGRKGSLGLGH